MYNTKEAVKRRREALERDEAIPKEGREAILRFLDNLAAQGRSDHRAAFYLTHLPPVARDLGAAFANPSRKDLERVIAKIERTGFEYWTKVNKRTALKAFYRWFLGDGEEYPACVRWMKTKNGGLANHKLPTDLLTRAELEALVKACRHPRDKALVSLAYDSGCRISEILTLTWAGVSFDDFGAVLMVTGKTGQRRVRVIGDSIAHLAAWRDIHPLKARRDSPVFVGLNGADAEQGRADQAMNYAGLPQAP